MDYGRTGQSNSTPSSMGISPDSLKQLDNIENGITEANAPEQRDLRDLGNRIIRSPENSEESDAPDQLNNFPKINPELGKIVDLSMPPGADPKETNDPGKIIEASFNRAVIKTDGNRISSGAIKEINRAKAQLDQTGNISDFYDTARSAMEANLDNSYGRKLAA